MKVQVPSTSKLQEAQGNVLKNVAYEDSQAWLKQTGLYDHVSSVLLKLATEKPKDALEIFENVSTAVKSAKFTNKTQQEFSVSESVKEKTTQLHKLLASSAAVSL